MKGFKTIIFNGVMAIIALVKIYYPETEMPAEVEVEQAVDVFWQIFSFLALGGNAILRGMTTTPIFKKG